LLFVVLLVFFLGFSIGSVSGLISILKLRKNNNDISDTMFRLNNVLTDTEIVLRNNLADIDDELNTYRNDKYRLFNSSEIQEYNSNNQL